jgi:hypothetical protein
MYFSSFPKIIYDLSGNNDWKVVTNLIKRVKPTTKILRSAKYFLYDTYDVKNGETPESISDKLYGASEYHWVILFCNNIDNVYSQWPMNTNQFLKYLEDKHGTDINAVHHYEIEQKSGDATVRIDIGSDKTGYADNDIFTITNREYEEVRQDEMRKIWLLDPQYLNEFVEQYQARMNESIL